MIYSNKAFPLIRGEATSAVYHGEKLLNEVIKVLDVLKLKGLLKNSLRIKIF